MNKHVRILTPFVLILIVGIVAFFIYQMSSKDISTITAAPPTPVTEIVWSELENETDGYRLPYPDGSQIAYLPEKVEITLPASRGKIFVVSDQGEVNLFPKYLSTRDE